MSKLSILIEIEEVANIPLARIVRFEAGGLAPTMQELFSKLFGVPPPNSS